MLRLTLRSALVAIVLSGLVPFVAFGAGSENSHSLRGSVHENTTSLALNWNIPAENLLKNSKKSPAHKKREHFVRKLSRVEVIASHLPWCMRKGAAGKFTPVGFKVGNNGGFAEIAPVLDFRFRFLDCPQQPQAKRRPNSSFNYRTIITTAKKKFTGAGMEIIPNGRHDISMPTWFIPNSKPRTTIVKIGDLPIRLHLRTLKHEIDLGDGGPHLICPPNSNQSMQEFKKGKCKRLFQRTGEFIFKLKTSWEVSFLDPLRNEKVVLPIPLVTEESTEAQTVKVFHTVLTDDVDELRGR